MTWKHFFDFTLDMLGAAAFGALMGLGIFSLASLLDDVFRALRRRWRNRKGTAARADKGGDDQDNDGGVGGAPVCP